MRLVACKASKRLSTELARSALQVRIGSAMPLKTYGEISDVELAALWLYLRSE